MSYQVMAWATEQELPCKEKMVLLMLANRTNHDTGRCDPSHRRLSFDCGLSESSVKRAITELSTKGFLEIQQRTVGDVNLPNQYVLKFGGVGSHRTQGGVTQNPGVGSHRPTKQEDIKQEDNQKKPSGFDPAIEKPENVSDEVWEGFCKMRKAKRAVLTERACQLIAKKLVGLSNDQADAVVDKSTARSWTDVFPEQAAPLDEQKKSSVFSLSREQVIAQGPRDDGKVPHFDWDAGERYFIRNLSEGQQ